MKSRTYHAFYDLQTNLFCCSVKSERYPLVVNCAGISVLDKPFTTHNPIGREDYYLLFLSKGELSVAFPDGERKCGAGTLIIFPPKTPYTYSLTTSEEMIYYYVHFSGSAVEKALFEYGLPLHPDFLQTTFDSAVMERFLAVFDTFAKTDKLRDRELYLNFDRLLMTISRNLSGKSLESSDKLRASISYVHANLASAIKIKDLARIENMSVSAYNALFVKTLGIPPGEYIITTRLAYACALLTDTDISVSEVGEKCGYSDPQFFSKFFKSHIGKPPRSYRNEKRKIIYSDKL